MANSAQAPGSDGTANTQLKLGSGGSASTTRPMATAPAHSFPVDMALISHDRMTAIAGALHEAKDKKPGAGKFIVGLAAPLGLIGKSLRPPFDGYAMAGVIIGVATAAAVLVQLINDRKPSKLLILSEQHADEWLRNLRGPGGPT